MQEHRTVDWQYQSSIFRRRKYSQVLYMVKSPNTPRCTAVSSIIIIFKKEHVILKRTRFCALDLVIDLVLKFQIVLCRKYR